VKSSQHSDLLFVYRQAHPLGRLCFSLGLFAAVLLINKAIPALLTALTISVLLLHWRCGAWQPVIRAARLLLWLLVPILLLHLLFTPGQLLWPGSSMPFTREGMFEGVWLALRLCTLFYAAMLLSRSLSRTEWACYCLRLPYIGPRLLAYLKLSDPIRVLVSKSMVAAKQECREFRGLRDTPRLLQALNGMIANVWHGSAAEAEMVWQHWDEDGPLNQAHGGLPAGLLLGLCGFSMPIAACLL